MKSSREVEKVREKAKEREKAEERAGVQGRDEAKEAIDAVITWVDGSDLKHRKKRLQAMNQDTDEIGPVLQSRSDETRFLDNGELRFCISSIRRFAPWIRKIFLVTDNQRPDFLTPSLRNKLNIELVDHADIFAGYEWALPTFNTRTIETALWRIPGLSDRFIYFNDDFVIIGPVRPEDFFNGRKVIIRGSWNRMKSYRQWHLQVSRLTNYLTKKLLGITRTMHLLLQMRSAKLAGFSRKYYRVDHVPHPVYKSVLEGFFEEHGELFDRNIRYRFRDIEQFSAIFLAYHLKIAKEEAELVPPDEVMMVHGEMDLPLWLDRKIRRIENSEVRFISLQGIEKMHKLYRRRLEDVLTDVTGMDF